MRPTAAPQAVVHFSVGGDGFITAGIAEGDPGDVHPVRIHGENICSAAAIDDHSGTQSDEINLICHGEAVFGVDSVMDSAGEGSRGGAFGWLKEFRWVTAVKMPDPKAGDIVKGPELNPR